MNIQKYLYKGSPFLPVFDREVVIANSVRDINKNFEPATAIAFAISTIMIPKANQLRNNLNTLAIFGTTKNDLDYLTCGYQYPIESILATAVCKKVPKDQRASLFEQILYQTHNFLVLRMQDQILIDLNATINLLNLDPSGALVFQYLKDYPFSQHEYFLVGMEIATITFFGISIGVAEKLGNDDWLNKPYDPTILT